MDYTNLDFYPHHNGFQAIANFPNGYGVSILPEADGQTYEVAVLRNGSVCYDSGLTTDTFRYVTRDSARDVYFLVQALSS